MKITSPPAHHSKGVAHNVPFSALTGLYENLVKHSKHAIKKQLLAKFFEKYKKTHDAANGQAKTNYFPLMRLLLPQLDKDRQTYGLKETMLGKYYVDILNIAPTSEDAIRLLNWRKPSRTIQGNLVHDKIMIKILI